jgi:DNA-binding CsgD family transcriptional regulator
VSKIHDVKTVEELETCFQETLRYYMIENFSIISITKNSMHKDKFSMLGLYPNDWIQTYKQKNYHTIDPVLQRSGSAGLPYRWESKGVNQLTYEQKIFFEAAYDHDIKAGITIPFTPKSYTQGYLTILNSENYREEILYSLAYLSSFYLNFLQKMKNDEYLKKLTPRELEILLLKSKGYGAKEVSSTLGISDATAVFHLKNIREKLNTNSTEQSLFQLGTLLDEI